MVDERYFPFEIDDRFRPLLSLVHLKPDLDGLRILGDGRLVVTMGRRILDTPLENIAAVDFVEGLFWPLHIGVRTLPFSKSVTFATNVRGGTRLRFDEPVAPVVPLGQPRQATVTIRSHGELLLALHEAGCRGL